MRSLLARFFALLLLVAHEAPAQSSDRLATIVGTVRDATDSGAVGFAEIRIAGGPNRRSDGLGRFHVEGVPVGRLELYVRVLGYSPQSVRRPLVAGENAIGDVYLTRVPKMIAQVTVRGRAMRVPSGFERIYQRAKTFTGGQFLTREQIDSMNPPTVADLLATATNVRVRWTGARYAPMIRNCIASIFLNGMIVHGDDAMSPETFLPAAHPQTLQVMEVYDSPTKIPLEFRYDPQAQRTPCAVVLVWTRAR